MLSAVSGLITAEAPCLGDKSWSIFKQGVIELIKSSEALDSEKIQALLKQIVPTYSPRSFSLDLNQTKTSPISIKAEA